MKLAQVLVRDVLRGHVHDFCEGFAVEFYHFIIKEISHGRDFLLIILIVVLVDLV